MKLKQSIKLFINPLIETPESQIMSAVNIAQRRMLNIGVMVNRVGLVKRSLDFYFNAHLYGLDDEELEQILRDYVSGRIARKGVNQ